MKYAVLCVLDLDVEVLDSTKASEVEKITKKTLEILVDGKQGLKIRYLRPTLLGTPEKFGEGE